MKCLFSTVVLLGVATLTFGQTSESSSNDTHPIEKRFADCLEKEEGQTTMGMMECAGKARDEWDKELNKYYKLLMGVLSAAEKTKLQQAQRKWIEYRDTENAFSGEMYYNMEGTMWRITAVERQVELVKERALTLQSYYETLKESK
ncbi:DUF1311 domain-containing protein [Rhodocytophaga rosea]|uniref:DUF1311 domain-containing protein n=1 Tax=Rhodocytophaga rosea TaxID=2704465 RepID=A0A6C0GMD0_9BACT|nr:lysozyme inhibitor LprI family protein [Rhodocytophaga rosea]QHT69179.1 DUF1311 domain-containing protein [Rhodocytophaga rosea]